MHLRSLLVLTLVLVPLWVPLYALAAPGDVGYVDMQRVLDESALGKKLQEQLRKQFEPKAQELGREEREIVQMQETLKRDSALMSTAQLKKKEDELKERVESFQKKAGAAQQELAKAQQEKAPGVVGPAREAVSTVAKKKGLSMVMEPRAAGLIYWDASLEITDEVIKAMDAANK
jgi:outer membrane protein